MILINQELLELEVQPESVALEVLLESADMVEGLALAESLVPGTLDRPQSAPLDTRDPIRTHPGMVPSTKESRMAILINQELLEYLVLEELPESVAPEVLLDLLEPADMVDIAESRMAIPTSQEHQERPEQGVQLELVVPEMIVVPAERRAIAELAVPGTLDQPQSAPLDTRDRIRTRLGMVPSTTESRMAIPINQELLEHLVLEVQLESLALGVLLESVDMVERLAPAELAVPATLDRPRSALLDTLVPTRTHPGMVPNTNPAPAERDTRRRSRPPPPTNRRQLPAPAVRPLRDSKKMDPRAAPAESRAPAERRPPPTNQAHQVKEAKAE